MAERQRLVTVSLVILGADRIGGDAMKKKTPEQMISAECKAIRDTIERWKNHNDNGCNDPAWSDGVNMNLLRNHVIYAKRQIRDICESSGLSLPEEYYLATPPEVSVNYMANLKQKERVQRVFFGHGHPDTRKVKYDENQMSFL